MARKKSAFRKRANIRWLRHIAFNLLARAIPPIRRLWNVPLRSVRATDEAARVLENTSHPVTFAPTPSHERMVLLPARDYDTAARGFLETDGRAELWSEAALLEGCSLAGHSFAILRDSDGALVNARADAPNWNYGKPRRLKARLASGGLHAILRPTRSNYHFFGNELLPLLRYIDLHHRSGDELTVVTGVNLPAFQRDAIQGLRAAYPFLRFIELNPNELLRGAQLLWLLRLHSNYEWMPVERPEAERLYKLVSAEHAVSQRAPSAKLYVSRRDAKVRQLRNETELEAALHSRGFSTFVPGAATLAEQAARFHDAHIIVASHGAALTNLLFCRPGTVVIELFPSNFVKSTYLWLAAALGLNYQALIGSEGDFSQHFSVDLSTLLEMTDRVGIDAGAE